jgi:hypothetical protein
MHLLWFRCKTILPKYPVNPSISRFFDALQWTQTKNNGVNAHGSMRFGQSVAWAVGVHIFTSVSRERNLLCEAEGLAGEDGARNGQEIN